MAQPVVRGHGAVPKKKMDLRLEDGDLDVKGERAVWDPSDDFPFSLQTTTTRSLWRRKYSILACKRSWRS